MKKDLGSVGKNFSYKGFNVSLSTWGGPEEYSGIAYITTIDGNNDIHNLIELNKNYNTRQEVKREITKLVKNWIDNLISSNTLKSSPDKEE